MSKTSLCRLRLRTPKPPFIFGLVTNFQAAKGGLLAFTSPLSKDSAYGISLSVF
jgi:hypothetical protein